MEVTINDIAYEVPFDPAVITMGGFLDWRKEYGLDLDVELKTILENLYQGTADEIELQKTAELEEHLDKEALCWYSFWTKFNLNEARDHPSITPLLHQYRILRHLLKDNNDPVDFPTSVMWNEEVWMIQDFKVNPASEMSFNEIITSKEIMRQVHAIGGGKWDGLPYLCAVYLRKANELFADALIKEGSERREILKELPLKYALSVAFFLSTCVNTWSSILVSSAEEGQVIPSQN